MGINCPSFVGANAQVTCTFSPTVLTETNKDTNDPVLTNFNTEFTFTWLTPTGTNQMKDITYSVEFWLNGSITEAQMIILEMIIQEIMIILTTMIMETTTILAEEQNP